MIYGYARVSTKGQSIKRQLDAINNYNSDVVKIYYDKSTGKTMERAEWQKLLKVVKKGDIIIIDEVSRMSRNTEKGVKYYEMLFNQGIDIEFINEPQANTKLLRNAIKNQIQKTGEKIDYIIEGINKYMLALAKEQIKLYFIQAQKEIDDKARRQRKGYEAKENEAKEKGITIKYGHHKKTLNVKKKEPAKKIILEHSKRFNGTLKDKEVIVLAGISKNTFMKYRKELEEEQAKKDI